VVVAGKEETVCECLGLLGPFRTGLGVMEEEGAEDRVLEDRGVEEVEMD
jgi:hypothetical protein